jgi:hypothetical protein
MARFRRRVIWLAVIVSDGTMRPNTSPMGFHPSTIVYVLGTDKAERLF